MTPVSTFSKLLWFAITATYATSTFNRVSQAIIHEPNEPFQDVSPYYFNFGAQIISKNPEQSPMGEDALLASKNILGVADGVGGWALQGIDPSNYSYHLMENSNTYFYSYPSAYAKNPAKLVILSALTNSYKGTSTMTLCTLFKNDLYTANVGDSGYMILIPTLKNMPKKSGTTFIYDVAFVSEGQQHEYNFPFQLGSTGDDPRTATKGRVHSIADGTIVLTYTDGVSDNLFPYELRALVNTYIHELKVKHGIQLREFVPAFDPNEMAKRILEYALKKSKDVTTVSPFQYNSLNYGVIWQGGKIDDISIVVGMILKKPQEEKEKSSDGEEEDKKDIEKSDTKGQGK